MDASEVAGAPMSVIGISNCIMSGDSRGLLSGVAPNVALTRNLKRTSL